MNNWLLAPLLILATAADAAEPLQRWLERQTALLHWQADVVQVRALKGLARPLRSPGKAWIARPDRMRWELGQPPRTIAVRNGDQLVVHYPALEQTERYALDGEVNPAGRQALALLQAGFPTDAVQFQNDYRLLESGQSDGRWRFDLAPTSAASKRLLESVRLEVDAASLELMATEFRFPDGSTMRNEFSAHRINEAADAALFELNPEKTM